MVLALTTLMPSELRIEPSRWFSISGHLFFVDTVSRFWNCRIDLDEIRDISPRRPMRRFLIPLHDRVEDSRCPIHPDIYLFKPVVHHECRTGGKTR